MDDIILYYKHKQEEQKKTLFGKPYKRKIKHVTDIRMSMCGASVVIAITLAIPEEELDQVDFTKFPKQLIKIMAKHHIEERDITHCWYEPNLAMRLNVKKLSVSLEFLLYVKERLPFTDSVYLADGMQDGLYEFAEELSQGCNHFTIIVPEHEQNDIWSEQERTDRLSMWEEFAEIVYGQSGLMVQIVSEFLSYGSGKSENSYQKIVYDFALDQTIPWRKVPMDSIYVDFAPNYRKKQLLSKKREDISYCNYGNYLDINAENGYNILV